MTEWTNLGHVAASFLSQESSYLDLILQEDGSPIVVDYGTDWVASQKDSTIWSSNNKN